jgi:alkylhydroperoxidase family enzyme
MTSYSVARSAETAEIWRLPGALYALRPDAARRLDRINERIWTSWDPTLLEIVRLRVAWLIGNTVGEQARSTLARRSGLSEDKISELAAYPHSPRFSAFEREALAFAEQFAMDVGGTTSEALDALVSHVGADGIRDFVTVVYVLEFTQRLQTMAHVLLPIAPEVVLSTAPDSQPPSAPPLRSMLAEYQDSVVRGKSLDVVTTELVRLRCARTHQCRICKTLRLTDARAAGVDAAMTAKIDFYEASDLSERSKVALRITDAFIVRPDAMSEQAIEQARAIFSDEELVELCLDITKWSTQKIHVALGTDGADALPVNDVGVAMFGFQDDGSVAGYWAD